MSDDRWLSTLVEDLRALRAAMKAHTLSAGDRYGRVVVERSYVGPNGRHIVEWRAPEAHGMIASPTDA